nr:hypothetical protein [uncultured Dubosiella sp.]
MKISGYQYGSQYSSISFLGKQKVENAGQTNAKNQGVVGLTGDRDRVMISPLGQDNSQIKSLMGQKQFLLERKNKLIHCALENGGDRTSIQSLLDSYEEQLKELEEQISQEMFRQNGEAMEKSQESRGKEEPKTKEEMEQERMADLVELSSGMARARTVQASKNQVEGEARVLESEIKMDRGRTGDTEAIGEKEERLAQLQQKAAELTGEAAEISGDVAEKICEDNTHIEQRRIDGGEEDYQE